MFLVAEEDKIELNMAVVTAGGLIGKITEVNSTSSVVTLITASSSTNNISAVLQDNSGVSGLVTANSDEETGEVNLTLEVESDQQIESGDIIITSGMGRYPEGIIIGTVTDIEMDQYNLMQIAYIEPAANFNDINHVIVIDSQ